MNNTIVAPKYLVKPGIGFNPEKVPVVPKELTLDVNIAHKYNKNNPKIANIKKSFPDTLNFMH